MKQDKTDNELIAEFMGIVFWKQINGQKYYKVPKDHVYANNAGLGQFRYDKSWDWLMPVVEKIVDLGVSKASSNEIVNKVEEFTGISIVCPLNGVYDHVLKFIKWYNENSKK